MKFILLLFMLIAWHFVANAQVRPRAVATSTSSSLTRPALPQRADTAAIWMPTQAIARVDMPVIEPPRRMQHGVPHSVNLPAFQPATTPPPDHGHKK